MNHEHTGNGITFIAGKQQAEFLSYSSLLQKAQCILSALQDRGLKAGQELVFQINDNRTFICLFWAALLGSIIPVPVTPGYNEERRRKVLRIWAQLKDPYLIIEKEHFPSFKDFVICENTCHQYTELLNRTLFSDDLWQADSPGTIFPAAPADIAFIQFSSGSTGDPKGIILTHENLLTNIDAILSGIDCRADDACLSWMPLTHDMGLIGFHLAAIKAGIMQYIMPAELFLRNPALWMIKAAEHNISILSSPNFGYKHFLKFVKPQQLERIDLSRVRIIFNGAEPIAAELCQAFCDALAVNKLKRNTMFPVYGLAEASLAVTFPQPGEALRVMELDRTHLAPGETIKAAPGLPQSIQLVDVGSPVKNCAVRICDDDNTPLPENTIGQIQISGKNVTNGYYNTTPEDLFATDGWLKTGDLGFMHDGRLVITGRVKDVLFHNGQNYYSHDIENIVLRMQLPEARITLVAACGVRDSAKDPEKICLFISYKKSLASFAALVPPIKKYIHLQMGLELGEILPVKKIPVTTSGKIQRYQLNAQYENGDFKECSKALAELLSSVPTPVDQPAPRKAGEQRLGELFGQVLEKPPAGPEDNFFELGGDSLKASILTAKLLQEFGVDLTLQDIWEHPTVARLHAYIQGAAQHHFQDIPQAENRGHYPLTPAQQRLYILTQQSGFELDYNLPGAFIINGVLEPDRFTRALQTLVQRHESLRTSFPTIDNEPVQKIHPRVALEIDYRQQETDLSRSQLEDEYRRFIRPFRLAEPPLLRAGLIRLSPLKHLFLFDVHHITTDGTSVNILVREFALLYDGQPLPPVKLHYKDYALWYNRQQQNNGKLAAAYWTRELGGDIPALNLPADFSRFKVQSRAGSKICLAMNRELTADLKQLALAKDCSLFMLLLAVYNVLLFKYSGQEDILIGSPAAGRNHPDLQDIPGMFVNTLVFRNYPRGNRTFSNFLAELTTRALQVYAHQDYPFDHIVRDLNPRRNTTANPLFHTMFTLQNTGNLGFETEELQFEPFNFTNPNAKFELTLFAAETAGQILLEVEYRSRLFKEETIKRLGRHFIRIAEEVTRDPDQLLAAMDILLEEERDLFRQLNRNRTDFPARQSLGALFEQQAAAAPSKTALILETEKLSYGELNRQASRFACYLQARGCLPGEIVGLWLERSCGMIISILGILKAGATYLPLDTAYPPGRIHRVLADAGARFLVTHSSLYRSDGTAEAPALIMLDKMGELPGQTANHKLSQVDGAAIAYIMYTSGSTGIPKGNLTTHYNITRVVKNTNYLDIRPTDRVLQLSNYAFDGSTFDIFGALLNGATLVLVNSETLRDLARLTALIRKEKITIFFVTTALFNMLVDYDPACLQDVRHVLFGGERVSPGHVKKALAITGPGRLIHVYGPTESTVFATYYPVDEVAGEAGTVPIGKPVANTEVFILAESGHPQPVGVPGELYLAGAGLIKAYLDRPRLTAEKFPTLPSCGGKRVYKTGDLVRLLPDGNIEFIDRIDTQVKLRGFRIEPGEIEYHLQQHDAVKEAVVILFKEEKANQYLIAYFVATRQVSEVELKSFLASSLPDYMVPAVFQQLEHMPLTSNGKINKQQLPVPVPAEAGASYTPPGTDLEKQLHRIWTTILGREQIGINDDFFELGGHSLNVTMLTARLRDELAVEVPFDTVFRFPTIKNLAARIEGLARQSCPAIIPAGEAAWYPVTPAQQRLFVQEQFMGIGTAYNVSLGLKINGTPDITRLENVFRELIRRHAILRTSFELQNGELVQIVHPRCSFNIAIYDAADKIKITPFPLGEIPLIRVFLAEPRAAEPLLVIDLHHIAADGVSVKILLEEFSALYAGKTLPALKLQYRDYAVWQQTLLQEGYWESQRRYWLEVFASEPPVLNMPADFPRPQQRSFQGTALGFTIPAAVCSTLRSFKRQNGVTLNIMLFSVYAFLLHKYTGQEDLVIGSLVAGRNQAGTESMVGMFNNFLPLRFAINPRDSFTAFLASCRQLILQAYANQDYPYDKIITDLALPFRESGNPLFDTMLIFHNETDPAFQLQCGKLTFTAVPLPHTTSKLDFKLDIYQRASGELYCEIEYNTCLYKKETIGRLQEHYLHILRQVLDNPGKLLAETELITPTERSLILDRFNATSADFPDNTAMHYIFEQQAAANPGRIALVYGDTALTYGELNGKANLLAARLKQLGVGRNSIVGIFLERSLEMSIALLAVFKAGGAYLPLSPEYPARRIEFIIRDSGLQLLLTVSHLQAKATFPCSLLLLDDKTLYEGKTGNPPQINQPVDLAYIIYTSGSTGQPKGVMIEHRALVNRLNWMQKNYPLGPDDAILQKTPSTFDVSLWELFWWIFGGARLCYLEPGGHKDPAAIVQAIARYRITVLHFVPSMLDAFLNYVQDKDLTGQLTSLKQVFASGEALLRQQVHLFNSTLYHKNRTRLTNLYGPTEATVDVSCFDCLPEWTGDRIPIGKPIDNIQLYVLDKYHTLQPVGVTGELYIAGAGLARSYLNREALTAEKFVSNPFQPGSRMYKTGDYARWLEDGNLEFLDRIDNQVKIRGFRIELGEIENVLRQHPAIRETVTLARADAAGSPFICTYYIADQAIPVQELRAHCSRDLAEYMIPAIFMQITAIPLSANGKIDRRALPEPVIPHSPGKSYMAPATATEKSLALIWQEVLGLERPGINDNLFDTGGNSLKAITIAAKIHKELGVELQLNDLFNRPTIREAAELIDNRTSREFNAIKPCRVREYYPLSSAQFRLYILHYLESNNINYNLPAVILIEGELDFERINDVFRKIIRRHEILRTSFFMLDETPFQKIHEEVTFTISRKEMAEQDIELAIREFIRPFDMQQAPLLRCLLVKAGPRKHFLMLDMHHIVADGVSSVILVREFVSLYEGKQLPPLKIQYKDYACWQKQQLQTDRVKKQGAYWHAVFPGEIPVLNLPYDFPRPAIQSFAGHRLAFPLDRELIPRLDEICNRTGTTRYMFLLAAYAVLLYRYSGQQDIIIGSATAGRQHADVEQLIGMFVSLFALRLFPEGTTSFTAFLQATKETVCGAFANLDYQFETLVENLDITRDISRNPLFDAVFIVQNIGIPFLEIAGLKFLPYEFENRTTRFDLTFEVVEEAGLTLYITYCIKLFKQDTINRMARHYFQIIRELVADPEITLDEILMISPREKEQLLYDFNRSDAGYPADKTVHQLFEEQAACTPDAVAVKCGEQELTYRQLNTQANQLGHYLRSRGVGPDTLVGICMQRSPDMITGILGILKAGGAYLPINPGYPEERILVLLDDSRAPILLTDRASVENRQPPATSRDILILDELKTELASQPAGNPGSAAGPANLAYVIYTSGSTGKPKGVMIEHRNVVRLFFNDKMLFDFGRTDTWTMFHSFGFDFSVWEMYGALLFGGKLIIVPRSLTLDPQAYLQLLRKERVTVLNQTPTAFTRLNHEELQLADQGLDSLRFLIFGGEALDPGLLAGWREKYPSVKLINMYGITETTVHVTYKEITEKEISTGISHIGEPIPTLTVYILNNRLVPVPLGVAGEIYVGGAGVARGYLNRPQLTAERFIANPFVPGTRLYKTGDLARRLEDGSMEYLGRADSQIKVRGFRIEPGEIRAALLKHEEIQDAVIVLKTDHQGNKFICAYLVMARDATIQEMKLFLGKSLPEYMIPAFFICLRQLPLTANGKTDFRALPNPTARMNTGTVFVEPAGEVEQKLLQIWTDVLGTERIGVHDNFFDIGGNSIVLLQLHTRIKTLFPGQVQVVDIFANPTISKLARFLQSGNSAQYQTLAQLVSEFPEDYFAGEAGAKQSAFAYQLGRSLVDKLATVVEKTGIEYSVIFITTFLYLLARITGKTQVSLPVMVEKADSLVHYTIDLDNFADAGDLYKNVYALGKNILPERKYELALVLDMVIEKKNHDILPLLYDKKLYTLQQCLPAQFDLALEYRQAGDDVHLQWFYNYRLLDHEKMKDAFSDYIQLLELLADNFLDQE